jgi:hypothetical protein
LSLEDHEKIHGASCWTLTQCYMQILRICFSVLKIVKNPWSLDSIQEHLPPTPTWSSTGWAKWRRLTAKTGSSSPLPHRVTRPSSDVRHHSAILSFMQHSSRLSSIQQVIPVLKPIYVCSYDCQIERKKANKNAQKHRKTHKNAREHTRTCKSISSLTWM